MKEEDIEKIKIIMDGLADLLAQDNEISNEFLRKIHYTIHKQKKNKKNIFFIQNKNV